MYSTAVPISISLSLSIYSLPVCLTTGIVSLHENASTLTGSDGHDKPFCTKAITIIDNFKKALETVKFLKRHIYRFPNIVLALTFLLKSFYCPCLLCSKTSNYPPEIFKFPLVGNYPQVKNLCSRQCQIYFTPICKDSILHLLKAPF